MKLRKYLAVEAALIFLILLWAFLKVQMDDERYYMIFDFENKPESFDSSGGVINIDESLGLGSDAVIATIPAIHIQGGRYYLEIDHQGDTDATVVLNNEGSVFGRFLLPKEELLSTVSFEAPGDLYSFSVDFLYPGEGSFTLKHVYLRTDGVFYTDTIAAAVFLILVSALFILWAYRTNFTARGDREKLIVFAVLAFAVFINYPCYWSFTKNGGDMQYHLARVENLKNELFAGQFPAYIYFIQNKYRGYLAAMYPETFLYIPAFLRAAGVSLAVAWKYFIILINISTMAVSYYFAKKLSSRRDFALLFMVLYTALPYRIELIAYRNAIGEILAFVFLPILFLGLYETVAGDKRRWPYLVAAMTGLINSHIISSVFAVCLIAVVCLCFVPKLIKEGRILPFIYAGLWSLAMNLWFILPFLYHYRYSDLALSTTLGTMDFSESAVFPAQLFMLFAGKGAHSSNKVSLGIFNECSLTLGAAGFILLGMAVYFSIFKKRKTVIEKAGVLSLILGLILMFMSVTWFPWQTLQKFEPLNRFVSQFQFPTRFRMLGETFILLAGVIALFGYELFRKNRYAIMTALTVAAVFYCIFTFDSDLKADENYMDAFGAGVQEGNYKDYVPVGYSGSAMEENSSEADITGYMVGSSDVTFDYRAGKDTFADIKRIYYAGYKAYLSDGTELQVSKGDGGRLRIALPAGDDSVTVVYEPPFFFKLSFIVSLLACVLFCVFLRSRFYCIKT